MRTRDLTLVASRPVPGDTGRVSDRMETLARQYCEQALQPLLDDGRVSQLTVQTEHQAGRLAVLVELIDAAQNARTFQLHVKVG